MDTVHAGRFRWVQATDIFADVGRLEDCSVNLKLRCPRWLCGYGWGKAGVEDVAELIVEDIGYPVSVCVGDTIAIIETFLIVSLHCFWLLM